VSAGTPGTWVKLSSNNELGYAEITATATLGSSLADVAGLSTTVTVGTRPIRITVYVATSTVTLNNASTPGGLRLTVNEGATVLQLCDSPRATNQIVYNPGAIHTTVRLAPSAGSHTYKLQAQYIGGASAGTLVAGATFPAFIQVVEL
jgi:hypothetical protein